MKRLVVDSNKLNSPDLALRTYLEKSKTNIAVLTDYSAIEAYKSGSIEGLCRSMSILSKFPDQVLVLKTTIQVCGLHGRPNGLQKRLIDFGSTKEFPRYVRQLRQARDGNHNLRLQLLDHCVAASHQMDRIIKDARHFAEGIAGLIDDHSEDERRQLRGDCVFTPKLIDKTVKNVLAISVFLFRDHPSVRQLPSFDELLNTYIFRYALCTYLLALDWGSKGGVLQANLMKHQNDQVDMSYATYATFFDGLLTGDKKCARIYQQSQYWLATVLQAG